MEVKAIIGLVRADLEEAGYTRGDLGSVADRLILIAYYANAFNLPPSAMAVILYFAGALPNKRRIPCTDDIVVRRELGTKQCCICDMDMTVNYGAKIRKHKRYELARLARYHKLITDYRPKLAMYRACIERSTGESSNGNNQ